MRIKKFLKQMIETQASDLFLRTMALPRLRINGRVQTADSQPVSMEEMAAITNFLLDNYERKQFFVQNLDIDFIYISSISIY